VKAAAPSLDETVPGARPRRILVVALGGIGDVLTAEPAVRALRGADGVERLGLLARGFAEALLEPQRPRERLFAYDSRPYHGARGKVRLVRDLTRDRYDLALCLWPSSSLKCVLIPVLARIRARFIHRYRSGRGRLVAPLLACRVPYDAQAHRVERNLSLLASAGFGEAAAVSPRPRLVLTLGERLAAGARLDEMGRDARRPLVAVHPGSTSSREGMKKRWPPDAYVRLIDDLTAETGAQVLIVAGPAERDEATAMARAVREPVLVLEGCVDLRVVAAVLAEAHLLVSNDSGVGHLAAAVGTPVVSLFGPTNPGEVRPFGDGAVVQSDLGCVPCTADLRSGPTRCEAPCMEAIEPAAVLTRVKPFLAPAAEPVAAGAQRRGT